MSAGQQHAADNIEADSKTRLRLWLQFLKMSRSVETQLRENLRREFATTLPRFDVMAALSRYADGLKMSELSGVLRVSNGNMTGIIDRLTSENMVVRVPVPGDRRAHLVKLTAKGHKEFALQATAHENWIDELLSMFSAEEAQEITHRLDLFTHNKMPKEQPKEQSSKQEGQ